MSYYPPEKKPPREKLVINIRNLYEEHSYVMHTKKSPWITARNRAQKKEEDYEAEWRSK